MFEAYGHRTVDVLQEVRDSLCAYVESDRRLVEYLAANSQIFALTPRRVILLISKNYHGGVLRLYDSVPSSCSHGPEERYFRVKEAEQCITGALREVYGIKKKTARKKGKLGAACFPASIRLAGETEEERAVKQELRWVFSACSIKKELEQLKDNLRYVAANKGAFPAINEYATFVSFDRRIRPFIAGLELEVLPHERSIGRVEHFLRTLYREADKALARVIAKKAKIND
ncbi:MAG: hypothetical protein AAB869_02840 [Patescibacteria group bacterium]